MAAYEVVPPGGGARYDWQSDHILVKAGMRETDGRVTVVEDTLDPGFHLPRHFHERMTEVFYVLTGEVAFRFDDGVAVATAGTTVTVPPGVRHEVSSQPGATVVTVFAPGGFEEYLAELDRLSADGQADEGVLRALAQRHDIHSD